MTAEEKYNLAMDIVIRAGIEKDKNAVISIADCIKNNRFFYEIVEGNIILFLTWEDNIIDGKRYIFVNNLFIDPENRNRNTLLRIRFALKYLLKDVHKFYWFNHKKQKMIYRR